MPLTFAAILPHGGEIVAELAPEPAVMAKTRAAMLEAGRRFADARIDTVIVLDPHADFLIAGAICVGATTRAAGIMGDPDAAHIAAQFECDLEFVDALFTEGADEFPLVRAVGAETGRDALLPLSWGALIPLWFTARPLAEPPKLVAIAPSRTVPRASLVEFGALLARLAAGTDRRIALIASADQGHAHDPEGPYGFSPASAEYDLHYAEAVADENLGALLDFSEELVREAKIDSLWQTLVLHGALLHTPLSGELLSYEAPTYFGMLVAAYIKRD